MTVDSTPEPQANQKEQIMNSAWRVTKVTMTEGRTVAELVRVEWFKASPEYRRLIEDESYDGDLPDEFDDVDPGTNGAEFIEVGEGKLTIDITDGIEMRPGDNVSLTLDVLDHVSA